MQGLLLSLIAVLSHACDPPLPGCSDCDDLLSPTECYACDATEHFKPIPADPTSDTPCECEPYYFFNSFASTCSNCPMGCIECSDHEVCEQCDTENDFVDVDGMCECAETHFLDDDHNCIKCADVISGCVSCDNEGECGFCDDLGHFEHDEDDCVCMDGYYFEDNDPSTKSDDTCESCTAPCVTCVNEDCCITCDTEKHFQLLTSSCTCQCEPGYSFEDYNNNDPTDDECLPDLLTCNRISLARRWRRYYLIRLLGCERSDGTSDDLKYTFEIVVGTKSITIADSITRSYVAWRLNPRVDTIRATVCDGDACETYEETFGRYLIEDQSNQDESSLLEKLDFEGQY